LLLELVDAQTGQVLVEQVERTAQTRSGPYAADLPDLFIHWTVRPGAPVAVLSPTLGMFEASPPHRSGHHHADGFFIARGPGLAHRAVADDATIEERYGRWWIAGREMRWLRRNALIVIGNVADPHDRSVRSTLERYRADDDPILAEHAAWAQARLDERAVADT
jgi:hypothetical protein